MKELTAKEEDTMLEEGREKDYNKKNEKEDIKIRYKCPHCNHEEIVDEMTYFECVECGDKMEVVE